MFAIFVLSCWSLNVSNFIAKHVIIRALKSLFAQNIIRVKSNLHMNLQEKLMQQVVVNFRLIAIFERFVHQ